jgi:DNA-binding CsgD family transcriptional regulator
MKKNIKWFLLGGVLILTAIILFIIKKENPIQAHYANRVDSLIHVFEDLPEGKYETVIAREQVQACYQGTKEDCERITAYFEDRARRDNNKTALIYLKSNKASILLSENKMQEGLLLAKEAEKEAEGSDIVGLGNIYNTIATAYYYMGRMDSAEYYMTKGYLFATTKKIDVYISTFAINLGTYYYDHLMYGAASYYFNVALEASKRQDNIPLMLINNITTILAAQHQYKEADSLWSIYLPQMEKEKDPYEHQLYFINRILHLQNADRWKECRRIYTEYEPEEIHEGLRISYMNAMLHQLHHDQKPEAGAFFIKYRHWLGERYVPAVSELFAELRVIIERNPSLLPMDTLLRWEKEFAVELKSKPQAAARSNKLKSLIAYKNGNIRTAYDLLEKSYKDEEAFEEINDSLRHADFAEKNQLSKLKEDVNIANLKVDQEKKEQKYVNYLWLSALVILIVLIVALLLALSYRKTKLKYAMEQITFMKLEEDHLVKEQELNTRIVNLSQLIVLKSQDLAKRMKLIASEDKEALQDVKKKIDELSLLGIEDKPQLADKLIDDHQAIFDRFPEFTSNTNLTEKRIFILSIDGYKPKEIANVVGVSIQYVHNVRTRLRKKLNLDNNIEWESLKKI